MTPILLAACALALGLTPAVAQEPVPARRAIQGGCFARAYDAAHLARQPDQQVTAMRVSLVEDVIPGSVGVPKQTFVRLEISRRPDARPLRAIGTCVFDRRANRTVDGRAVIATHPRADGVMCLIAGESLDAEGGEVLLSRSGRTLTVHVAEGLTLRRGATVSAHPGEWITFGQADRVFRLSQADPASCKGLDAAIGFR